MFVIPIGSGMCKFMFFVFFWTCSDVCIYVMDVVRASFRAMAFVECVRTFPRTLSMFGYSDENFGYVRISADNFRLA